MVEAAYSIPFKTDDIETIAANSFRNFHAKGLDYLCLQRSAMLTVKAYFYESADGRCPEIVSPHDHRYPFSTAVLSGRIGHFRYEEVGRFPGGSGVYQKFNWRTPLNGGSGFEWQQTARLKRRSIESYSKGESYWCDAAEVHTISILEPGTTLLLFQHADIVPLGEPTVTFVHGLEREPPSLSGLYDRMSVDHARKLISRLTNDGRA